MRDYLFKGDKQYEGDSYFLAVDDEVAVYNGIDKRLNLRNRKCPACAVQFDYQSVKDLYLTA